jgi:hypothetical protein
MVVVLTAASEEKRVVVCGVNAIPPRGDDDDEDGQGAKARIQYTIQNETVIDNTFPRVVLDFIFHLLY